MLFRSIVAQNDRLLEVHQKQLAAQHAGEALMGRMHNMSVSWMRKEGPYKVVKRGEDGADPTAEPYVRRLLFLTSSADLSVESARLVVNLVPASPQPRDGAKVPRLLRLWVRCCPTLTLVMTDEVHSKPAADVSLEDARHTIAAECGMAEWQDEPPAAEEKK